MFDFVFRAVHRYISSARFLPLILLVFALSTSAQTSRHAVPRGDENMKTGPEVGQKIPAFRAVDQFETFRDFDSIKGPNGAVILFYRSADW
ncbi:hypothetical protein ACFLT7_02970 [candidate division KSB1 bacterium]